MLSRSQWASWSIRVCVAIWKHHSQFSAAVSCWFWPAFPIVLAGWSSSLLIPSLWFPKRLFCYLSVESPAPSPSHLSHSPILLIFWDYPIQFEPSSDLHLSCGPARWTSFSNHLLSSAFYEDLSYPWSTSSYSLLLRVSSILLLLPLAASHFEVRRFKPISQRFSIGGWDVPLHTLWVDLANPVFQHQNASDPLFWISFLFGILVWGYHILFWPRQMTPAVLYFQIASTIIEISISIFLFLNLALSPITQPIQSWAIHSAAAAALFP